MLPSITIEPMRVTMPPMMVPIAPAPPSLDVPPRAWNANRSTKVVHPGDVSLHEMRRLATVNTFAELQTALSRSETAIRLAPGTYHVAATLSISWDVTITAETPGSVVLDGGNARRVITISGGTVALNGLNITNGYSEYTELGGYHGGGISISSGTLTAISCSIYSNSGYSVCARFFEPMAVT